MAYEQENRILSIIMPVYNRESTVERTAEAVLSQHYNPLELILIDDGSTDRSRDICRKLAEEHKDVICIRQENKGPAAARNRGLEVASGKYIAFVDSDDIPEPDMYDALIGEIEAADSDIAVCGYSSLTENKRAAVSYTDRVEPRTIDSKHQIMEFMADLRKGCGWSLWNKVYKAELIRGMGFDESLHISEDLKFNIQAFFRAKAISFTDKKLYHYNDIDEGLSKTINTGRYLGAMKVIESILEFDRQDFECKTGQGTESIDKAKQIGEFKSAEELYGKGACNALRAELMNQGLMALETLLLTHKDLNGRDGSYIKEIFKKNGKREAVERLRSDQRPLIRAFCKNSLLYKIVYYMELPLKLMMGGGVMYKRVRAHGK